MTSEVRKKWGRFYWSLKPWQQDILVARLEARIAELASKQADARQAYCDQFVRELLAEVQL